MCLSKNVRNAGKVWWNPILLVNCSIRELRHRKWSLQTRTWKSCSCMLCNNSLMEQFSLQQDGAPRHFANLFTNILRRTFPCKMDRKRITVHHMAATWTYLTLSDFSCGVLLRNRSARHQYVIWQTYKEEFLLLSTMSQYRCFITYGSRLNTGWNSQCH